MPQPAAPTERNTPAVNPLTVDQVKALLRPGSIILWPYRGSVEDGHVVYVSKTHVAVSWLEGYRSRNDDVPFEEVLAIHNPRAPEHSCGNFRGKGFLTQAGAAWVAKEQANKSHAEAN